MHAFASNSADNNQPHSPGGQAGLQIEKGCQDGSQNVRNCWRLAVLFRRPAGAGAGAGACAAARLVNPRHSRAATASSRAGVMLRYRPFAAAALAGRWSRPAAAQRRRPGLAGASRGPCAAGRGVSFVRLEAPSNRDRATSSSTRRPPRPNLATHKADWSPPQETISIVKVSWTLRHATKLQAKVYRRCRPQHAQRGGLGCGAADRQASGHQASVQQWSP